ncbi:MAG: DUF4783 domain-containing protein [Chitinophagales bacterium]|nr:DUF4783 domain-containing protein [Chitinophagales bacterium]
MKRILLVLLIITPLITLSKNDILDTIATAIRSANSRELSKYFDATVEITIVNNESVYSNAQAEMVLRDFFLKNSVQSFEIIHRGTSGEGSSYGVGTLKTSNQIYRVYFLVRQRDNTQYIRELRFEKQ